MIVLRQMKAIVLSSHLQVEAHRVQQCRGSECHTAQEHNNSKVTPCPSPQKHGCMTGDPLDFAKPYLL